jgi:hypothetical protein
MDIRLLARVVSRFRYLALAGVLLAVAATVFSAARLDTRDWRLHFRQQLQYQSTAVLLVDGNRPSWLYAVPPGTPGASATTTATTATTTGMIADPARLGGLTSLYGYFVQSDAVHRLTGNEPVNSVSAVTITADVGNGRRDPLPLLAVMATGGSPHAATDLDRRVTAAFQRYVRERQTEAHVSDQDRVTLRVVNAPSPGTRLAPRSYTRAIVAGLLTIIATIGLMLVIENLRPSTGPSPAGSDAPTPPAGGDAATPDEPRVRRPRTRPSTTGKGATVTTMGAGPAASTTTLGVDPGRRLAPPG